MRLFPRLDYGTRQYPEKIARRLRAMNLAAWIAAALAGFFAARRLTDPAADKLLPGLLNLAGAVGFAALPVLHRFGPLVAPGVFVVCAFAFVFWVIARGGTDGGAWLNYLAAVPLVVLLFGAERLILSAVIAAIAAILIIVAHLTFPANTGYVSETSLFYGNFVTNVVVAMALLFAVVHYALRQVTEAEAAAEREHARSEHLLLNILPPRVAERLKEGRENVIADSYEATSVLFADMAGFTRRAGDMTPEQLVQFLNRVFLAFDELVERHGLEKRRPATATWWSAACPWSARTTRKRLPNWRWRWW
ncbi:MAG: hypothetical protein BroJett030_03070 [Alphaproteobacteria bacterium]|nr:MAG: hypothetical protein BroJett030_03070 [Alphaproteobacteria bacterium]